ncbi:MAG: hypothetical protein JST11_07735 [Acidobacteria bacterium]|nr:hypothetical protein [Acidobacteriota bacterium]
MRTLAIALLFCPLLVCGAAWMTHTDPAGFTLQAPAEWRVAADRASGRVTVTGPARQQAIVWPVWVPGALNARSASNVLASLAAKAGIDAAWRPAPSPGANSVRFAAVAADRAAVAGFGWVPSAKGSAGFLYIALAPTAAFRGEAENFARIFASFRATGASTGGAQSAGSDGANLRWTRWQDPRENAFSLEVPAGWNVEGGAYRFAAVDIRKAVRATSPDGRIRITGGDQDLPTFTEPNQMLAMTGFREGSWYSPGYGVRMMVRRYTPGTLFAQQYVSGVAARGCADLAFTGSRDRPDADAPLNRLMSGLAAAGGMMQIRTGETTFTCRQNGQPAEGYYLAGSLRAGMAGSPSAIWHVEYLYGYLAAAGQVSLAQQVLAHMLSTYQDNPQWVAMQQNVTANTSRIVAQTQQEVSKIITDTFNYRNQVNDEISRRRENSILGTVDVVDPSTGRQFKVENSSNYYWLDHQGVIAGTRTDTSPGWNFREMVALP